MSKNDVIGWEQSDLRINGRCDRLEFRLSTLEGNLKWLYEESGLDYPTPLEHTETDIQPSEVKALDSTKTGEVWLYLSSPLWILWKNGDVEILEEQMFSNDAIAIMPYHPGDKKPAPPKTGGE
jgi:hypothetical protein